MIGAVDFLLYCAGSGIVLVSAATAVRLIASPGKTKANSQPVQSQPKWEAVPDPTTEGLGNRLAQFQQERFASPIVRRTLSQDAGPRQRTQTWPVTRPRPPVQPPTVPGRMVPKKPEPKDG